MPVNPNDPASPSFTVRVVPSRYSAGVLENIRNLPDGVVERDATITAWICHMLAGWDLTDQGQPVPVTPATLDQLGFQLKMAMFERMHEPLLPNVQRPKSSDATSEAAAAVLEASPTGTPTSPAVNGSATLLGLP